MSEVAIFYYSLTFSGLQIGQMLEPMDQSLPPRPALFLRLMLILKPSRFGELSSDLWVTHPHTKNLFLSLMPARSHPRRSDTGSGQALPNSMPGSSQCQSGLAPLSKNQAMALRMRIRPRPPLRIWRKNESASACPPVSRAALPHGVAFRTRVSRTPA